MKAVAALTHFHVVVDRMLPTQPRNPRGCRQS